MALIDEIRVEHNYGPEGYTFKQVEKSDAELGKVVSVETFRHAVQDYFRRRSIPDHCIYDAAAMVFTEFAPYKKDRDVRIRIFRRMKYVLADEDMPFGGWHTDFPDYEYELNHVL